jgi:hypothetical protein|nr:hypothetical protein [Butyrivibrio fibrisolvens]
MRDSCQKKSRREVFTIVIRENLFFLALQYSIIKEMQMSSYLYHPPTGLIFQDSTRHLSTDARLGAIHMNRMLQSKKAKRDTQLLLEQDQACMSATGLFRALSISMVICILSAQVILA